MQSPPLRIVCVSVKAKNAEKLRASLEEECSSRQWPCDITLLGADESGNFVTDCPSDCKPADLVIILTKSDPRGIAGTESLLGRFGDCGKVIVQCEDKEVPDGFREVFSGDDGEFSYYHDCLRYGGALNYGYIADRLFMDGGYPRPIPPASFLLWHPDVGEMTPAQVAARLDPSKPTVGMIGRLSLHLEKNEKHHIELIRAMERGGLNVIPAYISTLDDSNSRGENYLVKYMKEYFFDGDRRLVDVIIVTGTFSIVSSNNGGTGMYTPDELNFLRTLTDVPVLQVMAVKYPYADFEAVRNGTVEKRDISVVWPEVDGEIITVPVGDIPGEDGHTFEPLQDRIEHIVKVARNWGRLAHTPVGERKLAILLYQSSPNSGRIGAAYGIDTIQSARDMLQRFKELGYKVDWVPETEKELIERLLAGITNDQESASDDSIAENAPDLVSLEEYSPEYAEITQFNRDFMEEQWGKPPGEVSVSRGKMVIPGVIDGNIYIGYQPLRAGLDQHDTIYHSPVVPITHQYLAFYRWLQRDFGANVVFHMGCHGTLEWLPGRSLGLSGKCFPDLVLDGLCNVYPFIIDDPGEGIQTKRRSESVVIGHMGPTMARSGTYDEIEAVDEPLQEYFKAQIDRDDQRSALVGTVLEAAKKANLLDSLGIPEDISAEDFEGHLEELHDMIMDVKDSLFHDGLHVLGEPPEGELLAETVYSLTRVRNGDVPSLRKGIAEAMGYDIDAALDNPHGSTRGRLNSSIVDEADEASMQLIRDMQAVDFDADKSLALALRFGPSPSIKMTVAYICGFIVPNLLRMTDEMDNLTHACDGGYVLPGPSGAVTRGNAHLLPMGRNYYGIDPDTIPTPAAMEIGRKMADETIRQYIEEKGEFPREVAVVIWATDTQKTNGDDVAYILWMLGVRPVRAVGRQVVGLEPIPLSELGRPRIDVSVRITGLFRDMFPNLIDMLDDAARIVQGLDEDEEMNAMAANVRRDIAEQTAKGIPEDEARRRCSVRVFGCPPAAYGPGINRAIATGDWKTNKDLADVCIAWGGYGYGRRMAGEKMADEFVRSMSRADLTAKNMPDNDFDILNTDDVYGFQGGLNALIRSYGGHDPMSFSGDSSDPDRLRVRETKDELNRLVRSRALNPKFIEGLKRHGYRGVIEVSTLTDIVFGWDATSDIVDDWVYQKIAERYILDEDTREWMETENPYATKDVISRLLEAYDRGMWEADDDTIDRLKDAFIEVEGEIEGRQDTV